MQHLAPEMFEGSSFLDDYRQLAPDPGGFPKLLGRIGEWSARFHGIPAERLRAIQAPVMVVAGDSDVVTPEHVVETFRLFGGGVPGDIAGLPPARLAILPGTTHVSVVDRAEWLAPMIAEFLDAPAAGE
jgi:pimeloyl-ACP methyl ester carboxylesterase